MIDLNENETIGFTIEWNIYSRLVKQKAIVMIIITDFADPVCVCECVGELN